MTITVANIRTTKAGVYIGRAMPRQGLKASPLGNPYKLRAGDSREEVLEQYAAYMRYLLKQGHEGLNADGRAVLDELSRLTDLARAGDLVLLCWCAPLSCHGDVVKAIIEARLSEARP